MFSQRHQLTRDPAQVTGSYQFIDCDCRSTFPTLLIDDKRFVQIKREHACTSCKQRVQQFAEQTGQHLLLEV